VTRRPAVEIEARAAEVLRNAGTLSAPIDLNRISESLGARTKFTPLEDKVSGALLVKGNEKHIMINSNHSVTRQRFTLAHEIGHLQLHDAENRLFIDEQMRVYQRVDASQAAVYQQPGSMTTPVEEQEANMFAACLLMPRALLERAALERDLTDELEVSALATAFCVSEQAMSIRLQQLKVVRPLDQDESGSAAR
jgi:Zn-dependent peptidase ImmA (M78 family)